MNNIKLNDELYTEHLDNMKESEIVSNIKEKKQELYKQIYARENEVRQLRKNINNLNNELLKICDHNWIVDVTDCSPCSRTKICTI